MSNANEPVQTWYTFGSTHVREKAMQVMHEIEDAQAGVSPVVPYIATDASAQTMNVSSCRGILLGTRCHKHFVVPVPVIGSKGEAGEWAMKDVCPQTWMTNIAENDWGSKVKPNWTATYMNVLPFPISIITESWNTGDFNRLVWDVSKGTMDWIGTVLIVKHSGPDRVVDMEERDYRFVEDVLLTCVKARCGVAS